MPKCTICREPIKDATARAIVCKGEWVDGVYIRSECDKERRRRHKRNSKSNYRKGGKYYKKVYKYKPKITNTCLKCNKKFQAKSRWNKICSDCTLENERNYHEIGSEVRTPHRAYVRGVHHVFA